MKRFLFILVAVICSGLVNAQNIKVVFINPGHPEVDATGKFWSKVDAFMHESARDLEVELVSLYAERNHILMKSLIKKLRNIGPDYVVLVNEKGVATDMVKEVARYEIPIFMLLNRFSQDDLLTMSVTEKSAIIGSLVPDNYSVGKNLAKDLIALHRKKTNKSSLNIFALYGDYTTPASLERESGFKSVLEADADIKLVGGEIANWSRVEAFEKLRGVAKRLPIDIVWAANDPMAFGASEALAGSGRTHDTTVGGINWDIDNDASLDVSYGGHVTLGALAIVMLSDFHHGLLNRKEMHQKVDIFKRGSESDIKRFNAFLGSAKMQAIDFSRFSGKTLNPTPFNVSNIMAMIR